MPGGLQVRLGLLRDIAGVPAVALPGDRIVDEAVHVERLVLRNSSMTAVDGIREQDHVRLLDRLEPADRRAVEPVPVLEGVLGELVDRHREVLHQTGKVAEPEVDDLDPFVLRKADDLTRVSLLHRISSSRVLHGIRQPHGQHCSGAPHASVSNDST